jgi:hypothetical protein
MTDARCEPPDAIEAAGNAIIEALRGRRGFTSLLDSIDDDILAALKVTVGLKAVRAYLDAAPVATPATVRALVEALEGALDHLQFHGDMYWKGEDHARAVLARAKAEGL